MDRIGKDEIHAVSRAINSRNLFRYRIGKECARFEARYAERLGVRYCPQTASGTNALTAALIGAGVGPGHVVVVQGARWSQTTRR